MKCPRQRYLRAFDQWLKTAATSLPLSVRRTQRGSQHLVYTFDDYPDALTLVVLPGDISIRVSHIGRPWDMLMAVESVAVRVDEGYRCALCPPDDTRWPDRAALWIEHDFMALADWLRTSLVPADLLDLHQEGSVTWADLVPAQATPQPTLTMRYRLPGHQRLA